jgi:hypothetical protein
VRRLHYRARLPYATSEADERVTLARLAQNVTPTFIEFGFEPVQFNCVGLARDPAWQGLLIDGGKDIVEDARLLWPDRIRIEKAFLSLDNLDLVCNQFPKVGVLSIDVDGNDYWLLKALIGLNPNHQRRVQLDLWPQSGHRPLRPRIRSAPEAPQVLVSRRIPDGACKDLRRARLRACRRLGRQLQRLLHAGRQPEDRRRFQAQTIAREAVGNSSCGAVGFCEGHAV